MRKLTEILGLIIAIIIVYSSFAYVNHYPGSGIGFILGIGILLFPFLILITINQYKERRNIFPYVLGGFSILFFLIGFIFVILHLKGGSFLLIFGLLILLLLLFALGFIQLFKKPENRHYSIITISFIIIGASLLYVATYRTVGKGVIDGLISTNETIMQSNNALSYINNNSYNRIINSKINDSTIFLTLRDKSNELVDEIEELKKKIAVVANNGKEFIDYSEVKGISNIEISNVVMIEKGNATILRGLIENYRNYIHLNNSILNNDPLIDYLLSTDCPPPSIDGTLKTWEESKFQDLPLMSSISNLSSIQLKIRTCEMVILNQVK